MFYRSGKLAGIHPGGAFCSPTLLGRLLRSVALLLMYLRVGAGFEVVRCALRMGLDRPRRLSMAMAAHDRSPQPAKASVFEGRLSLAPMMEYTDR
jgi:hypothetical protein